MHPQPPAPSLETLERNGIIKITRIHRVDRHDQLFPAIPPPFAIGRRHFAAQSPGLSLHFRREPARQLVLPNHRLDIDTRCTWASNHLHQFTFRRIVARRPLGDLDHHPVATAGLRPCRLAKLGQINVVRDARVARHDVPKLPRLLQRADHLRSGTLEHLNHLASRPGRLMLATPLHRRYNRIHQHQHSVIVHRRAGGVGGDVDGRLRCIGGDDAAASSAVHEDAPGDQVLFGRERKPFVRQPNHPARAQEAAQFTPHLPGLLLAKSEFFGDLICPGWNIMFAPQKTHKSIFKIHQVIVYGSLTGLASSSLPASSLPQARLYPAAEAPTTITFQKPRTNIIGQ